MHHPNGSCFAGHSNCNHERQHAQAYHVTLSSMKTWDGTPHHLETATSKEIAKKMLKIVHYKDRWALNSHNWMTGPDGKRLMLSPPLAEHKPRIRNSKIAPTLKPTASDRDCRVCCKLTGSRQSTRSRYCPHRDGKSLHGPQARAQVLRTRCKA